MPKANSPPLTPEVFLPNQIKSLPNDLSTALASAKQRFTERNPTSAKLFETAVESLPGGNTRTLIYSAPFPVFMKKGVGYQVWDEDGHV